MDRADKMPLYAVNGVTHVWLVDPESQTLEVFVLKEQHWLLQHVYQQDEDICAAPFDALGFGLGALWA